MITTDPNDEGLIFVVDLLCSTCGLRKQVEVTVCGAPDVGTTVIPSQMGHPDDAVCFRCRCTTLVVQNEPTPAVPARPKGWR